MDANLFSYITLWHPPITVLSLFIKCVSLCSISSSSRSPLPLDFYFCAQVHAQELNNGVINACFLLLFKDLIKLYACYSDGIINLLGRVSPFNLSHD